MYYNIHTVFKLGSVIYSNILKVSAKQGCIYLYRKNYMPDSRRGSQKWPKIVSIVQFIKKYVWFSIYEESCSSSVHVVITAYNSLKIEV